jgi:hypothetical protein
VVAAIELAGAEREFHGAADGGVRHFIELGASQIRDFAGKPMQLDDVGVVDLAQIRASTAFIDPEQRRQGFQGRLVDQQGVGSQPAHRRFSTGLVDLGWIAGLEQNRIGRLAGPLVRAEEFPDVALQI